MSGMIHAKTLTAKVLTHSKKFVFIISLAFLLLFAWRGWRYFSPLLSSELVVFGQWCVERGQISLGRAVFMEVGRIQGFVQLDTETAVMVYKKPVLEHLATSQEAKVQLWGGVLTRLELGRTLQQLGRQAALEQLRKDIESLSPNQEF